MQEGAYLPINGFLPGTDELSLVPTEYLFDKEFALIELILGDCVFIGRGDTPFFEAGEGEAPSPLAIWFNCNDLWAWACADAEIMNYEDIEGYYIAMCDPRPFAITKWICKKFGRRPMPEIIRDMQRDGVWDEEMENLPAP